MRVRGIPWSAWPAVAAPGKSSLEGLCVFLCICDHWEPKWNGASRAVAAARVQRWVEDYPRATEGLCDSAGRPPQHTFFYPAEEYEPAYLDALAELCLRKGLGDVEVHLHHDNDTPDQLRALLLQFAETLHVRHGLLTREANGQISYGFIHGNWALCNSLPSGRWCGVNDELTILRETGCYADFTMPAAPSPAQTSTVNRIYYAKSDARFPKGHDRGIRSRAGVAAPNDALLMIQGPLTLDWGRRKWGVAPRLENGDLTRHFPPTLERFSLWRRANITVAGRPDWVFIKLHTHGAQEGNAGMLLGSAMRDFHRALAGHAAEKGFQYFYVTAREMAALVHQAESGSDRPFLPGNAESGRVRGLLDK